jgi:hypothetical protein
MSGFTGTESTLGCDGVAVDLLRPFHHSCCANIFELLNLSATAQPPEANAPDVDLP